MIEHYFTLAWRQLLKYKLQSAVSIVSLAIGFACFALASMWIKYETTYDAFHKDADRMYCLMSKAGAHYSFGWNVADEYSDSILKYCHEVELSTAFQQPNIELLQNEPLSDVQVIHCDSNFLEMFNIRILEGTNQFLYNDNQVAVTREVAEQMWPDESPIGKEMTLYQFSENTYTVAAVVDGWKEHSCFPFDVLHNYNHLKYLRANGPNNPFSYVFAHVFRLHPRADVEAINERLDTLKFHYRGGTTNLYEVDAHFKLVPINRLRHVCFNDQMKVKLEHIYLFALAGGLLILCGLLNYLTMFVNRLFIRQREIALRTVFGASGTNLTVQFLIEYGILLAIALFWGVYLMKVVLPYFRQLAELPEGLGIVYREGLVYLLLVVALSLLISLPVIGFFRRQALQNSIQSKVGLFSYNNFRKLSVCLQMSISILFIFCTVVMQKQLHALRNDDIGFDRKDMGVILIYNTSEEAREGFVHFLRQQSEVIKAERQMNPLFPNNHFNSVTVEKEKDKNDDMVYDKTQFQFLEDKKGMLCELYGLRLLKGRLLQDEDDNSAIVINEAAAKQFNWDDPIGKQIKMVWGRDAYHIVGVVKDFHVSGPTTPAGPTLVFKRFIDNTDIKGAYLIVKYKEGAWNELKKKCIENAERYNGVDFLYLNVEEEYDKLLESEKNLQKLLTITTIVCILIALFGVWSMIMLTCEQRRKEIAIRKVFGATVKDILDMFFLEYMTLQGVAALVAFPLGYACMKPWLEQYVVQTEISWWIYVSIFMAVALLVALCIGWRVWKTATARPADEICKG